MALSASPAKVTLSLRGLSMVFLLASITLLFISDNSVPEYNGVRFLGYKDFSSYKYMVGAAVIGMGYSLLQIISFGIFRILMKKDSDVYYLIEFYGDKAVSFLLATGSAAGFGATIESKERNWTIINLDNNLDKVNLNGFFNVIYASATLLFLAFLCTAILSILSSYALPKKV
ncbi:CASP-like protein 4D2 [Alnus glutinosa]|uniref:CASP-like protein 4D2 n=1 Tax=Alnus glutinosa TaxID=3517 RepID=UPI002D77F9A3|nr:CASP-like protein 4D2 [Alnus glutinosa]